MKLDISSPSVEIKQVELEYEQFGKHCFFCLSLSHESDDCPSTKARANSRDNLGPYMGISQNRTLDNLEADMRKKDSRKRTREEHEFNSRPAPAFN
ncbi:hypothetical protein Bca4012_010880 [Brassica carinata]